MKVFISYAREDWEIAEKVWSDLRRAGIDAWIDRKELKPGQRWRAEISRAIKDSSHFVALLSTRSVSKQGFFHTELRKAIEVLDTFSEREIYFIPVRIDDCEPPYEKLEDIHWADLFPSYEEGVKQILSVLVPDSVETPQPISIPEKQPEPTPIISNPKPEEKPATPPQIEQPKYKLEEKKSSHQTIQITHPVIKQPDELINTLLTGGSESESKKYYNETPHQIISIDKFCGEFWRNNDKSDLENDDSGEPDLEFLLRNYQNGELSHENEQKLLKRVICQNSKLRKIWGDIKRFAFYNMHTFYCGNHGMMISSTQQIMEACSDVLKRKVENCLKVFDLKWSKVQDNHNISYLLAGFINESLHYQKIIRAIGLETLNNDNEVYIIDEIGTEDDCLVSSSLDPEQEIILKDLFEKIIKSINGTSLKKIGKIDAFVYESITGQYPVSGRARQQKTKLKHFLKRKWELDDNLSNYIIERISVHLFEEKIMGSSII